MGKRLSLPFSGAQRALEGFTYRIFDRRQASLPMGPAQAPCLPLSDRSPLLAAAFLPRAEVDRRVIDIWLVDDIPAEGSDMIMTDGAGLISPDLAALLPQVLLCQMLHHALQTN